MTNAEIPEHRINTLNQQLKEAGVNDAEIIREGGSWLNLRAEKDGEPIYIKYAKEPSEDKRLRIAQEIWAYKVINDAGLELADGTKLTAPRTMARGESWYMAEWIEGKPLLKRDMHNFEGRAEFAKTLSQVAEVLSIFDKLSISSEPPNPRIYFENPREHWKIWSGGLEDELLQEAEIERALKMAEESASEFEERFQLRDFGPWQILARPGELVFCDTEHASTHLPRYYDLAALVARAWQEFGAKQEAVHLIETFRQRIGEPDEKFWPAFQPLLAFRAVGVYTDAVKVAQQPNKPDTRPAAMELLEISVDSNIKRRLDL